MNKDLRKKTLVKTRKETPPTEDSKLPITSSLFRSMRFDAALRKKEEKTQGVDVETGGMQ